MSDTAMSDTPRTDASYNAWHGNAPRDHIWSLARDLAGRTASAGRAVEAILREANAMTPMPPPDPPTPTLAPAYHMCRQEDWDRLVGDRWKSAYRQALVAEWLNDPPPVSCENDEHREMRP
jgi:hypothetical protein